ncbi:MAG: XdhC/CoxI family protein [Hyphomicrobiaceae bacterium]
MSESVKTSHGPEIETPLAAARTWLARDGAVALATVIDTWGSSPVPVGGQMAIASDGTFAGSVSGGCVEGEVIVAAEDVIASGKAETLTFGIADETAWRVGLPCGGRISVRVERLQGAGDTRFLDEAASAIAERRGLVVETDLAQGQRTLWKADDANLPDEISARFRSARSGLVKGGTGQDAGRFVQALVPPARLVIVGATHIAQMLAELARTTGYPVHVVDPRSAFAAPERFPGAEVRAEWPQDALPAIGLDAFTAVAVVAHVEHIDDEALKLALKSPARYVGALGSKRNHTRRIERLAAAGLTETDFGRIANPIGIDIGAETPAEIALSILAEVVRAVRGTKAGRKAQG